MLIEYKLKENVASLHDKINQSDTIDRLYCLLKEDGVNLNYGDFIHKVNKNGVIKVLKSLGIYKTKSRGETKTSFFHPRVIILIETSCVSSENIGKNIVKLFNNGYDNTPFGMLDFTEYNKLESSIIGRELARYSTYIMRNKDNGLYKIGRSKSVFKRLSCLRSEISPNIELLAFMETDKESVLHYEYRLKRVIGEWFELTTDDFLDIFSKYKFKDISHLSCN